MLRHGLCIILTLLATTMAAASPFSMAAVVNDNVITRFEVDQRLEVLRFVGFNGNITEELALDQLIDEALVQFGARQQGLTLNDALINQSLSNLAEGNGISVEELRARLEGNGISVESLGSLLGSQLLWRDAMQRRFAARARPGEADIDGVLLQEALAGEREVRLQEIGIPIFERGEAGTQALVQQIYRELEAGVTFAELARAYSRTASRDVGGDTGWVLERDIPDNLRAGVQDLSVGQVSRPLPITNGVTLLRVADERTQPGPLAQQISVVYVESPYATVADARDARGDFDQCDDTTNSARQGPVSFVDIPEAYSASLAEIPIGQVSQPIAQGDSFVLLQLCARTVEVSPERRNSVADALFADRVTGYAEGYMQTLRRDALIERR